MLPLFTILDTKSIFLETIAIKKSDVKVKELTLHVHNPDAEDAKELFEFSLVACDSNLNIKKEYALQCDSVRIRKTNLTFVYNQYFQLEKVYPYYFIKKSSSKDINGLTAHNMLGCFNYYKDSKVFIQSEDNSLQLLQFGEALGNMETVDGSKPNEDAKDYGTLNLRYSIKINEY